jgi:hypothetical protein
MDHDVQKAADEQTNQRRERNGDVRVERGHCRVANTATISKTSR